MLSALGKQSIVIGLLITASAFGQSIANVKKLRLTVVILHCWLHFVFLCTVAKQNRTLKVFDYLPKCGVKGFFSCSKYKEKLVEFFLEILINYH